jgi:hypothetical protein
MLGGLNPTSGMATTEAVVKASAMATAVCEGRGEKAEGEAEDEAGDEGCGYGGIEHGAELSGWWVGRGGIVMA